MVLVFGAINLDLVFAVPTLPQPDQTLHVPAAHSWSGGKGGNQAVAAARDGARVGIAGAIGQDPLAELALHGLHQDGIDTRRVIRTPDASTGVSAICTDAKHQAHIVTASGANLLARAAQVEDAALRPGTVLLLQMEMDANETAALAHRARARGATVVLNFSPPRMIEAAVLGLADVLLLDEGDSGWLSVHLGAGVGAGSLRAAVNTTVVRTLGVSGLEYADAAGVHTIPGHQVEEVDRTGAQDCLAGVLAAGLERGTPLPDALHRANVAAALSCTRLGPQPSFPAAVDIDRAMEDARRERR